MIKAWVFLWKWEGVSSQNHGLKIEKPPTLSSNISYKEEKNFGHLVVEFIWTPWLKSRGTNIVGLWQFRLSDGFKSTGDID